MINSTTKSKVRQVANLTKKARARREEDLYVAEGLRICSELNPEETKILYVTEGFLEEKGHRELLEGFQWEIVSEPVMKVMADTQTPQGILALVRQKHYTLEDILQASEKPQLLILETIQDPGNLGTMIRAGEGAGITGILMDRTTADIYNPKVIRSTMGSLARVPFLYVENLQEACSAVKERGVRLFAAHLDGSSSYDEEDFTVPCAFLIGNEANGLSGPISALADAYIRIPMAGQVESLNAAIAASVLMFEAARQRRNVMKL